jgi:hypothetical protein
VNSRSFIPARTAFCQRLVENVLTDDQGEKAALKPGAKVDVVLEADRRPILAHVAQTLAQPPFPIPLMLR